MVVNTADWLFFPQVIFRNKVCCNADVLCVTGGENYLGINLPKPLFIRYFKYKVSQRKDYISC